MKYRILEALRECRPGYLSGEALSGKLHVSRTAIWKYMNELRQEGYEIDSVSRRGYKLVSEPDSISSFVLSSNLSTEIVGKHIIYLEETDSTNTRAKSIALEAEEGTVVVAGKQTSGKGRLGRNWESPAGTGLYLSVILKPAIPPEEVQVITLAASVAVVGAIKTAACLDAGIKWPNDILLEGKKVCGILTEMSTEMEQVNYIVLGIGINFSQKTGDFPEEIRNKATSITEAQTAAGAVAETCKKSELARALLNRLDEVYNLLLLGGKGEIIRLWREMSVTLGKEVAVTGREISYTGKAVDITEDGRLVVLCGDGERRELLSGEISVRGLLGYG